MSTHRRCPDHRMVRAVRHEAATRWPRTLTVRCCFTCGEETPALYDRTDAQRNGDLHKMERDCLHCGAAFTVPDRWAKRRYCGPDCRARSPLAVNFGTRRRAS